MRVEAALYQRDVLGSEFYGSPKVQLPPLSATACTVFITEEAAGETSGRHANQDHVVAAFRALAQFHRAGATARRRLDGHLHRADEQRPPLVPTRREMFDRIFMIWGLATAFGITKDDLGYLLRPACA